MKIVNGTNIPSTPGLQMNYDGNPFPDPRNPIILMTAFPGSTTKDGYIFFSFWAINLVDKDIPDFNDGIIKPNMDINVYTRDLTALDPDTPNYIFNTGDIEETDPNNPEWRQYGFWIPAKILTGKFVRIDIVSSAPSGGGNDFAIDDVEAWFIAEDDVLPANFGSISASLHNNLLTINWSTLTETNNDRFEIEASKDGKNFTKINSEVIASKALNGNSTAVTNYSFSRDVTGLSGLLAVSVLAFAFGFTKRNRKWFLAAGIVCCLFAAGIACNKHEVSAVDKNQKLFIRIKQIDKDGSYTYSKVVQAVNEN
jgi:hypothetical protein